MLMECRICFDTTDEPLIEPCKCSGSMRWVHNSCLQKWINIKKNTKCPVCKEELVVKKNVKQQVAGYIIRSNVATTILTIIVGSILLLASLMYDIRMNTIIMAFLIVVMGIHYIQVYFEHEEINMELVFETIVLYSSRTGYHDSGGMSIVFCCLWMLMDSLKYKVLENFV